MHGRRYNYSLSRFDRDEDFHPRLRHSRSRSRTRGTSRSTSPSRSRSRSRSLSRGLNGSRSRTRGTSRSRSRGTSRSRSRSRDRSRSRSLDRRKYRQSRSRSPFRVRPPRDVLYRTRVVHLDDYKHELATMDYQALSRDDKIRLFSATIVPIAVPLAPGETEEEYERRFAVWLRRSGRSLAKLQTHRNEYAERGWRLRFARLNAKGIERFIPWQPQLAASTQVTEDASDVSSMESGEVSDASETTPRCQSTTHTATVAWRLDCGCDECLHQCVAELTAKLATIEERPTANGS